jgi:hypothetical protein
MKPKLFTLLLCFLLSQLVNGQILRLSHHLKQDDIQNANFTLHSVRPRQIHPQITLAQNLTHTLIKGLYDTVVTAIPVQVISMQTLKIRTSTSFAGHFTLTPSIPFTLVPNTEFIVPPNTPVIIPAGNGYITTSEQNVQITISAPTGSFTTTDIIRPLSTTMVRLTAKTKGIITVSSGKINFDPWQIISFASVPAGLLDVDATTTVPLELKDGRQRITDPTRVLRVPYTHYTFSLNSIPFRYRTKKMLEDTLHSTGTVTTAFSLALSFGHTWGFSSITTRARNDYAFTLGAFFGPSSVDLKKETVRNPSEFIGGRTNPVLSYGVNTIFSRNGFGFLLAAGFDKAYGKFGNDWIYDEKLWLGFGISASFPK